MAAATGDVDYYAVLQVEHDVTLADIKAARNRLMREAGSFDDSRRAEVQEAFSILSNEAERRRYDRFGLADLTEIRPGLFLGGESAAQRPSVLKSLEITHVLSCAHSMHYLHNSLVEAGLTHKMLDVEDSDGQDLGPFFAEAEEFIAAGLAPGRAILLHCQFGVSRSASFMAHHLMRSEGVNFAKALEIIAEKRPKVNPGPGFRAQLEELTHKQQ